MSRLAIRLLTLAAFSMALVTAPVITSVYAAPDSDAPAPPAKGKKKKSSEAAPGSEYAAFANGYRTAYATIYDHHDYASAIAQLQALGHDDSAAVANLTKMLGRVISSNIEVVTRFDAELCNAKVDPGQLDQVILNLALNARDAMPLGGTLKIETANRWLDER